MIFLFYSLFLLVVIHLVSRVPPFYFSNNYLYHKRMLLFYSYKIYPQSCTCLNITVTHGDRGDSWYSFLISKKINKRSQDQWLPQIIQSSNVKTWLKPRYSRAEPFAVSRILHYLPPCLFNKDYLQNEIVFEVPTQKEPFIFGVPKVYSHPCTDMYNNTLFCRRIISIYTISICTSRSSIWE